MIAMLNIDFIKYLFIKQEDIDCLFDEPLCNHTSFRIGGVCDALVQPKNIEQLAEILQLLKIHQVPFIVIGNGSNLLVCDNGITGVVIKIGKNMSDIDCEDDCITVQSGAMLSSVAKVALEQSLCGFEFAAGIPGSIGGAVVMNAGAYDGEFKDIVKSVTAINYDGQIKKFTASEMNFSYRKSIFQQGGYIILSAVLQLSKGDKKAIDAKLQDFAKRRKAKQPLELPSAGSFFKRPQGHFAGELIERVGLKGFCIGNAQISDKHAGFIVNRGGASCEDVLQLMRLSQDKVYEQFKVKLEPEVKILGE